LRIGSWCPGFPQESPFTILFQNCPEWQSVYERAAYINPETQMARRTLLSADQRTRVFGIPTEASEMAKHYVLTPEDLALIRAKRRSSNRLGFAVQLCLLRYPGQGLGFGEHPLEAMIAFVARQLRVSPSAFFEYALRDQTRREHAIELQKALGLRGFRLADWRACLNVGANAAWATDRGEPIVHAMLTHLRADRVIVPVAAVLERIGLAARVRARKRVFQALAEGLTDTTIQWLSDPDLRQRSHAGLNKGEASNSLRRAVFFPSPGRDPRPHIRKPKLPRLGPQPDHCGYCALEHGLSRLRRPVPAMPCRAPCGRSAGSSVRCSRPRCWTASGAGGRRSR
jgi:hypothetical protein